jgi:hypothetical protein
VYYRFWREILLTRQLSVDTRDVVKPEKNPCFRSIIEAALNSRRDSFGSLRKSLSQMQTFHGE